MSEVEHAEAWLPIKEAAERLGLSEKALRSRLVRRTLRSRRGNDGRVHVLIQHAPAKRASEIHRSIFGAEQLEASLEARQNAAYVSETMPVSAHTKVVESLQAAHTATVTALQAAQGAEIARIQTVHLGHIERISAQTAMAQARADAEIARMRVDQGLVWAVASVAIVEMLIVGRWLVGG